MKNISIHLIIVIAFLINGCGITTNKDSKEIDWNGTWRYSWDGGANYGGTPIFASYILTIKDGVCSIEAVGYQLDCHLECRGEINGSEYLLFYKSVVDNQDFSCNQFDKTEPLIVLIEKNGFLKIKETQLAFSEDITKIVFEKKDENLAEPVTTPKDPIELIRERFKHINDNISSYIVKKVDSPEMSTEGGELTFYSKENTIMKMTLQLYGEMGNKATDYYYFDNELFFIYDKLENYDNPIYIEGSKVEETLENRYYFENNKLIKWLDTNKKEQNPTKMKKISQKLIDEANELRNYY